MNILNKIKTAIKNVQNPSAKGCLAILFLSFFIKTAYAEDHAVYAREQTQKAKQAAALYSSEANAIVSSVLARQNRSDIKAFKEEIKKTAKAQCPMQNQALLNQQNPGLSQPPASPVLVFVSFSMPMESIKGWITQAKKADAAVYIRGLVNNSFKDTAKAVSELVQDQKGGLLIDPTPFKKYAITQVPAVVVTNKDGFDVIYGDVTLDYALQVLRTAISKNPNETDSSDRQGQISEIIKKIRSNGGNRA